MNNNTYGIVKPAVFDISRDVEIWYKYKPTRNSEDLAYKNYKELNPMDVLEMAVAETQASSNNPLPGMFSLKLPATIFGKVGIYTIYIKPKEYNFRIMDIGVLSAAPDIKGIVLDSSTDMTNLLKNDLTGYRVDYWSDNGIREQYYRIVTGSNACECMPQTLTNTQMNINGFRFVDSGKLVFLTVTPSVVSSYRANQQPYIGSQGQMITLTNTKFDPIALEIEITKHDLENVYDTLNGSQIHSLDNGLITTYNSNKEPILQHEYFTVKDDYRNDMYRTRINQENNLRPLPDVSLLDNN